MHSDVIEQILDFIRSRYFGKYRGTVVDNKDPTQRGRVQVNVPAVLGDLHVWAMPCVPYAGNDVGLLSLPDEGTGIWVEFEGGDPSFPIWVGCFWADEQLPQESQPETKLWKTPSFLLQISDKEEQLQAKSNKGSQLLVGEMIQAKSGDSQHTVSTQGIQTESGKGASVEVSGSSVKVNNGALEVV